MIDDLATQRLLGAFRGEAAVDRDALAAVLVGLGAARRRRPDVRSVDVNPLIVTPTACPSPSTRWSSSARCGRARPVPTGRRPTREQFAGAVRAAWRGGRGRIEPPGQVRLRRPPQHARGRVRGRRVRHQPAGRGGARRADACPRSTSCPDGAVDLVFVCTPPRRTPSCCGRARRRACGPRSSRRRATARRARTGGGAEAELVGARRRARDPARRPQRPGRRQHAGRAVRPDRRAVPAAGRIGVASQSGNFVSSFMNYARATGVGISRAVSAGNAAAVIGRRLPRLLRRRSARPRSGSPTSRASPTGGRSSTDSPPSPRASRSCCVKGGATEGGARAAASHTGALAADDKVFDGACRAAGITRAATVEEAFEAAATFATQPAPAGPNVVVLTTAGGWGVVTADAITPRPRPAAAAAARRPPGRDRRQAAAALEPQQPRRLRRRRDPRHDPRGA